MDVVDLLEEVDVVVSVAEGVSKLAQGRVRCQRELGAEPALPEAVHRYYAQFGVQQPHALRVEIRGFPAYGDVHGRPNPPRKG